MVGARFVVLVLVLVLDEQIHEGRKTERYLWCEDGLKVFHVRCYNCVV